MTTKLAAATANAMNDARMAKFVSGTCKIYTGSQPSTADSTATGSLLATITFDSTPAGTSSGGISSLNDLPLTVVATGTGTAGWFRIETSGAAKSEDGACAASSGAGIEMVLSTTSLVSGVAVTVTAATFAQPLS